MTAINNLSISNTSCCETLAPEVNSVRTLQNLPTYWVDSIEGLPIKLTHFANIREFKEFKSIKQGEQLAGHHYILDYRCTERDIKHIAWTIKRSKGDIFIYESHYPIADICSSIPDFIDLILSNSKHFDDWEEYVEASPITKKEAKLIGKLAIDLLSDDEQELELVSLQDRSQFSDFSWSKFVEGEKQARNKKNPDYLKLEIQRYIATADTYERILIKNEIQSKNKISNRDFLEIVDSLTNANSKPKATVLSAKEFSNLEGIGVSWLIPGILPAVGTVLVGGEPGAGKSSILIDCAGCILIGDEFLGEKPNKLGKVLIVNAGDEPLGQTQDKIVNRGISEHPNLKVMFNWDISQIDALELAIDDFRPDLIIIDSFASMEQSATFDENSAQAKLNIYKLNKLCEKYQNAIALIHHTSKSKENKNTVHAFRGSSALPGAANSTWLISGTEDNSVRMFCAPKIRGAEQTKPTPIKFDGYYCRFEPCQAPDTATKSLADRILDLFKKQPVGTKLETAEIIHEIGGNQQSVRKALDRLVMQGVCNKGYSKSDLRSRVYFLKKTGNTPPPLPRQSLSNNFSESIDTQGFEDIRQMLDTKLDTSNVSNNLSNMSNITQPNTQQDFEANYSTLATLDVGGGVSHFSESKYSVDDASSIVTETTPKLTIGTEVSYIGKDYPMYRDMVLVIHSFAGENSTHAICTKPDGSFTTNLKIEELINEF